MYKLLWGPDKFAKTRSKGNRPDQTKDTGSSRLKIINNKVIGKNNDKQ